MKQKRKDLGIWVSSDMKCSDQYLYAFNKASKVMGMIREQGGKDNCKYIQDSVVRPRACRILRQCAESVLQERSGAPGKGSTQVYKK